MKNMNLKKLRTLTPLLLVLLGSIVNITLGCDHTFDGGYYYDFSALTKKDGSSYRGSYGNYDVYFNICGAVSIDCKDKEVMVAQFKTGFLTDCVAAIGRIDPEPVWSVYAYRDEEPIGIRMTYHDGDTCHIEGSDRPRQVMYHFECDENRIEPAITRVGEPMPCMYQIFMDTAYACPGFSAISEHKPEDDKPWTRPEGITFLVVMQWLLAGFFVYMILGFIYNIAYAKKPCTEAIPHGSFWVRLPGLIKNGCLRCFDKTRDLKDGVTNRGYGDL